MRRRLAILLGVGLLLTPISARADAKSSTVIDMQTGRVLSEQNAHIALPMASTTKVMTALLALENADPDDMVATSDNAYGVPGTSMYLGRGETLRMEEMLYGLMLVSGNDAAVAIAEHVGGSVPDFCRMMTARAEEIGCENTVFSTPHGLPADNHHTTAHDLALIAREALMREDFRKIVSTQRMLVPWVGQEFERVLVNKNKLLSTYEGALGVKTGYTKAAGRCLVFAAEREGMTVVGCVLNCPDWFDEAKRLMDRAFSEYRVVTVFRAGDAVREVAVTGAVRETVMLVAASDIAAPMRNGVYPDIAFDLPDKLSSGVMAGDVAGSVTLSEGGEPLVTVPLVVAQDAPGRTFRYGLDRIIKYWTISP